jgi:diguanylate cyclase (GGDEF)-like protein
LSTGPQLALLGYVTVNHSTVVAEDFVQASRSGAPGLTDPGSLDPAAVLEVERLKFTPEAEAEFHTYFVEQSLLRARSATAIYLALVAVVTAINMRGGMTPLAESVLQPIYLLRLGVACPALILILAATVMPQLQRQYQWIASSAVIVTGMSVMAISALAAAAGMPQFQMGDVLVVVYATLFLGLLFRAVLVVAIALMGSFVAIGWFLGVPHDHLIFASSVVFATALMSVLSALRMERLVRANFIENRTLNNIAERDGLSGLYNRRMFDMLTNRLWLQAQRNQESLQIILVDIDHFKAFNDLYGHQAGDACIRRVAAIIAGAAKRPFDFCARYGGEEFALVLYAPSGSDATALAEEIRRDTEALAIRHARSNAAEVLTVSIGSATAEPGTKRSLAGLIQTADEALYRAKQLGRNRVLHVDSAESDTPTGAFKVFAVE